MLHSWRAPAPSQPSPASGSSGSGSVHDGIVCGAGGRRSRGSRAHNGRPRLPAGPVTAPEPVAQLAAPPMSDARRQSLERIFLLNPVEDSLDHSLQQPAFLAAGPAAPEKPQKIRNSERAPDYFAQVGDAIRTLRDDIPDLFTHDLNYSIYREDIVFKDPRNKFEGMKNYKLIFWSLRFHGRIFFTRLYVEVKRIWQPSDDVIKMRWTVHGIPRVPWEAEGIFDGISTYKLDNNGKVYEHQVDNVLLRDPPFATTPPLLGVINLSPAPAGQQLQPGAWFTRQDGSMVMVHTDRHGMPAKAGAQSYMASLKRATSTSQPAMVRTQQHGSDGSPQAPLSSSTSSYDGSSSDGDHGDGLVFGPNTAESPTTAESDWSKQLSSMLQSATQHTSWQQSTPYCYSLATSSAGNSSGLHEHELWSGERLALHLQAQLQSHMPLSIAHSAGGASGHRAPHHPPSTAASAATAIWASLLPTALTPQPEQDDGARPAASLGMATLLAGFLLAAQVYTGADNIIGSAQPPASIECTGVQHIHDPACYSHLQPRHM